MKPEVQSTSVALPAAPAPGLDPGARERLSFLYRTHHELIWRTLRRLGVSPEAAADATHQAYLITSERLEEVLPGKERAFLFATAVNVARTTARKLRRLELSPEEPLEEKGGAAPGVVPADGVFARQLIDRVLSRMEEELVTVFTLHDIEELTSPEIAELLQIPLGTVASRLRRAREAFRAAVARLELTHGGVLPGRQEGED